ncbi:streptomycin 6-kinase [Saccharothrix tamanrassetensis]|uniref:Streptomycin 6-kinase n=1 Tax=Saccharothrix tamanrassetensis TaxID=1051531 RepID=A0A841C8M9_9PSEU|nr:aminoglycoside phosphotransferase family protein [Saccharothrix tamanrassetensis]MBB5953471.1 streptomycin 6-kinase [Saccharothrix tamanrassetensis]
MYLGAGVNARLVTRFGPGVVTWVEALPALVSSLCARWGLEPVRELTGGTSHTLLCTRGTTPVVLKLTPEPELAVQEHDALRAWEPSPRTVRVVEADLPAGVLLLEGLEPGTSAVYDVPGMLGVLRALHIPPPRGFPSLAERVDFLFPLLARRRPGDYSAAHAAAAGLARDRVPQVLLHGDLHPGNVLDAGARGLVAIDPRPCVGDAAADAVDFAFAAPDLATGIEAMSAAVDGDRLAAWCAAFSVFFPGRETDPGVPAGHPTG